MSELAAKTPIDFAPGALLEARDFSDTWYPAKVVEVDLDGREVLVHFLNWSSRFDEWISMDSARLRPKVSEDVVGSIKVQRNKEFQVGDKVIALWKNSKKYPARVTRVINENTYEVIFYDGFVMEVRPKNMSLIPKEEADKLEIPATHPASITQWAESNPILNEELSKEERRKRKQKIDVVSLFKTYTKKKQEQDKAGTSKTVAEDEPELSDAVPDAAAPVTVSQSSSVSSPAPTPAAASSPAVGAAPAKKDRVSARESFSLSDANLPPGWEKRAVRRVSGSTAGKWDVVIYSPDSRAFRSRQDVRLYLSHHNLGYDVSLFDFRLGEEFYKERGVEPPKRAKAERKVKDAPKLPLPPKAAATTEVQPAALVVSSPAMETAPAPVTPHDPSAPSTPVEDGFRCPLEDCRKLFRRENLLMMHIKHYHPALSQQLGCKSLKVEDMATARTAYDTEEGRILPSTPLPPAKPLPPLSSEKKIVAVEPVVAEEVEAAPLAKRARGISESKIAEPPSPAVATKIQAAFPKKNRKKQLSTSSERVVFTIGEPETPTEAAGALSEDGTEDFDLDSEYMDTKLEDLGPAHVDLPLEAIPNQKELVHCYCGILEEDGLMIQCELCLAWQHGVCLGIESEKGVPDPYICQYCRYPFKERPSRHHSYDQSWIKKGKVVAPSFSGEAPAQISHHDSLRISHALVSAALELKEVLHSLRVQADIAQKKDHPKLYLWSKLENGQEEEPSTDVGPSIPRPEPPINSLDCRLNLLQHINQLQDEIEARLTAMESTLDGLEIENPATGSTSQFPRTLQALLKDVNTIKKMASYTPRQFF